VVLPQLRSMHASLTATTAWTCHSRQTDRWEAAAGECAEQYLACNWTGHCKRAMLCCVQCICTVLH
jgi:hypothetical protein